MKINGEYIPDVCRSCLMFEYAWYGYAALPCPPDRRLAASFIGKMCIIAYGEFVRLNDEDPKHPRR